MHRGQAAAMVASSDRSDDLRRWLNPFPSDDGSQDTAGAGIVLFPWPAHAQAERAQEPATNGEAAAAVYGRLVPALHRQPDVGRRTLWKLVAHEGNYLFDSLDAVLVIGKTALPKKGTLPVGVEQQYCIQLGKKADWQSLVSSDLVRGEVPV